MRRHLLSLCFIWFGACSVFVPQVGEEGQPCSTKNTCDGRLVCVEAKCVAPETTDGDGEREQADRSETDHPGEVDGVEREPDSDPERDAASEAELEAEEELGDTESETEKEREAESGDGDSLDAEKDVADGDANEKEQTETTEQDAEIGETADQTDSDPEADALEGEAEAEEESAPDYGLKWITIPSGSFSMGCSDGDTSCTAAEYPKHTVTVSAFEMTETEITQQQYYDVIGANPSSHKDCPNCPVEYVSWSDAVTFCQLIGGRLPSEAEWEYAARAGSPTLFPWGTDPYSVQDYAWFGKNSSSQTHPVATKWPNDLGLYDMLGNAWEHVADCWHDTYSGAPATGGVWAGGDCTKHPLRGGSYGEYNFSSLRVSLRVKTGGVNGFRCARVTPTTDGDWDMELDPDWDLEPAYCEVAQCFPIKPTRQSHCYDASKAIACPGSAGDAACATTAFCGQEAQYGDYTARHYTCYDGDGNAVATPGATAQEGETVLDSISGLIWQRKSNAPCSWQAAQEICRGLRSGGNTDWRLPNPLELFSLVDENRLSPAIDTELFPDTANGVYWSSMRYANTHSSAWTVDFKNGIFASTSLTGNASLRCVRGTALIPETDGGSRWTYAGTTEPIATDGVTGLIWQTTPVSGKTWQQALSYCEGLTYAQFSDWRLPDRKELFSILLVDRENPPFDVKLNLQSGSSYSFWTATSVEYSSSYSSAYYLSSYASSPGSSWKTNSGTALCVRGPERAMCAAGFVPGVTACDDKDLCTYGDTCNSSGFCQGVNMACVSATDICGARRSCTGEAHCEVSYPLAGLACESDNKSCTDDLCDGQGSCMHTQRSDSCYINGLCYAAHAVNPANSCQWCDPSTNSWVNKSASQSCDDGDDCTYGDHCDGQGHCAGTYLSCADDAGTCGTKRSCNGTDHCTESDPGLETSCNDGASCTKDDVCNGFGGCAGTAYACLSPGFCRKTAGATCNGDGSCSYPADVGAACSDDLECTYNDHCDENAACVGTFLSCTDDAGPCGVKRSCNGSDHCVESYPSSATPCSDSDACTKSDFCNGLGACVGTRYGCTTPGPCESASGALCTGDGGCSYPALAVGTACNDGQACSSGDTCKANKVCSGTTYSCGEHRFCDGSGGCPCNAAFAGENCDRCAPNAFGSYPNCILPSAAFCGSSACFSVPTTQLGKCFSDSTVLDCPGEVESASCASAAFCGQDAQYPHQAHGYRCRNANGSEQSPCSATVAADEVVHDDLTGLDWQRTFASDRTWQQALDYCDGLAYGGYSDWRLPGALELASLADVSNYMPAIDTTAFPSTISGIYFSSTPCLNEYIANAAWAVDFNSGILTTNDKTQKRYLRCVRGGRRQEGEQTFTRFALRGTGDVVAVDALSGLMWQYAIVSQRLWSEALSYCEALNYGGYTDWRLPSMNELNSLLNYSRAALVSDMPDYTNHTFWGSTTFVDSNMYLRHYALSFGNGVPQYLDPSSGKAWARCVRGRPGAACDDGQACTYGETYDASWLCGGGTAYSCPVHGSCNGKGGCDCQVGYTGADCSQCASGFHKENAACVTDSFRFIPSGSFLMGSPQSEPGHDTDETQHQVTLTHAFEMMESEVTQGQYQALMGNNPSYYKDCGSNCPVEFVSWYNSLLYANALSARNGLPSCYDGSYALKSAYATPYDCPGYRLPTEAEWEYAARGGTVSAYYIGAVSSEECNSGNPLAAIAWFCGNYNGYPQTVKLRTANAWGLYDMYGNIEERVWDCYQADLGSADVTDPVVLLSPCPDRVVRGGTASSSPLECRSASRASTPTIASSNWTGFRVARTLF